MEEVTIKELLEIMKKRLHSKERVLVSIVENKHHNNLSIVISTKIS